MEFDLANPQGYSCNDTECEDYETCLFRRHGLVCRKIAARVASADVERAYLAACLTNSADDTSDIASK